MAMYAIENGLDPFMKPDHTEWEGGLNPMYRESSPSNRRAPKNNNSKIHHFNTFKEAGELAKKNPGSKITRDGDLFAVYMK